MPALSIYEDLVPPFLSHYPFDTTVHGSELIDFVESLPNGHKIKNDLLVDDPGKQVSAIRRHLNHGGASRNLAERERLFLETLDAKRKTYAVRSLAKFVASETDPAFSKSVFGALNPLKRQKAAIDDIKKDELSDEDRLALENDAEGIIRAFAPLAQICREGVMTRWVDKLVARGMPPAQARTMIENWSDNSGYAKLLKLTTF
jgi:hypothetical protein